MSVDLDKQIDRAVREMLDVEPPADLRERVLAQLPAAGSRLPAPGFRLPASGWVLAPLAAAALILLAVFVARRAAPLPEAPVVASAVDRYLAPEAAPEVTRPAVGVPVAATRPAPAVTRRAPREGNTGNVAATSFTADDPETMRIEPLNRIASIAVAPIAQDTLAPAGIAVRPLNTITEIQIAPLTPPDRR